MLKYIGPVKASCKPPNTDKLIFIKVGSHFEDEQDRVIIKIDAFPAPHMNWNGFLNLYDGDEKYPA